MEVKFKYIVLSLVFFWFFWAGSGVASAEVSVIANKGISVGSVTVKEAKRIWLGKKKSMPGGGVIKLADLPIGNAVRRDFYRNLVKKKEKQLKAYWAKITFTGKGYPPQVFGSESEVVEWVASTPGAMGYVSSAAANDSVNVLLAK
ncbi:MAG: phosphate ABC transporter substrate-binding protein [Gammaproteobacteria bacterium]|nr:phosphate ABC transporter substrate-binding protein [Gammaproteobacteria bacterium]